MLILIGPSASGKTEVAKYLKKKYHIDKTLPIQLETTGKS